MLESDGDTMKSGGASHSVLAAPEDRRTPSKHSPALTDPLPNFLFSILPLIGRVTLGLMSKPIASFHAFKQSRWYRRLLWAGAAFLVYMLFGFLVLPPIIKS